jgi:hypothetical protein
MSDIIILPCLCLSFIYVHHEQLKIFTQIRGCYRIVFPLLVLYMVECAALYAQLFRVGFSVVGQLFYLKNILRLKCAKE